MSDSTDRILLEKALELFLAGYHFEVIARELGIKDVDGLKRGVYALLPSRFETVGDTRKLEYRRLEEMHKAFWPYALDPSIGEIQIRAANMILKIMKRRARLMGLDADSRVARDAAMKNRVTVIWDPFVKKP